MKLNFQYLMFLLVFACFMACNSKNPKDEESALLKSVMLVHDEVMPKMADIAKAETDLETLKKAEPNNAIYTEQLQKLQTAEDSMMDWMANFKEDFKGMSHEDIMKYLTIQKKIVDDMKMKILTQLKESQTVLQQKK